MTLTDLANHICEQTGMNDSDDVVAAKMFLQRRLEMVWNSQLWRDSLIEATMTVKPDGTCTLVNTLWIPSRATLLLPAEFDSVLAVRADNHAMNVASLESYYRTDTNWLDMQGDPTEFQVLSPASWEFDEANDAIFQSANGSPADVYVSTNGVSVTKISIPDGNLVEIELILKIRNVSGNSPVSLLSANPNVQQTDYNTIVTSGFPDNPKNPATWTYNLDINAYRCDMALVEPVGSHTYYTLSSSDGIDPRSTGDTLLMKDENGLVLAQGVVGGGAWHSGKGLEISDSEAAYGIISVPQPNTVLTSDCRIKRQRIRLTTLPQLDTSLRVLGKTLCPTMGDYDIMPINNVESCLMAFARADMLLRARQHGKAQLAMQEGAALLKQLADSESFQQAGRFQIMPDNGFGGDAFITQPNSFHPL